jgi:hypothetical protein
MHGARIDQITLLRLEDILLELHLQLALPDASPRSIRLAITYDAETIEYQTALDSFWAPAAPYYREVVRPSSGSHAPLAQLLGQRMHAPQFGFTASPIGSHVNLYYYRVRIGEVDFLFFNNGDQGAYTLDRSEQILAHDIYECQWSDRLPAILL